MKKYFIASALLVGTLFLQSCSDDNNEIVNDPKIVQSNKSKLNIDIKGLEPLGEGYFYEGWLMVDGKPVSAGIFNVDKDGKLSQSSFELSEEVISKATTYVLTIEPKDDNPAPSKVHVLAGDFSNDTADITIEHKAAIGTDLTSVQGTYILATPTTSTTDDELSGVWFTNLNLPKLNEGWKYEGWAVIDGKPVSTGTFSDGKKRDDSNTYSTGTEPGFPGEDFIVNAPDGLSFPADLTGATIVISVEPAPDNTTMPFAIKPLVSKVTVKEGNTVVKDHDSYIMNQNLGSIPTGKVTKK